MESKYPTTEYHSISAQGSESDMAQRHGSSPKIEMGDHPQMSEKRSWAKTAMWQTFALLWLVPVISLLYLNFTEYVIGASAWCPDGKCWLNAFNPITSVPQEIARRFDKEDHNLLGGLQFVAKGLEIWFGIVAAAVIYLITMRFAGRKEGLPIGYLTRPMEFADVLSLIDPLMWVTGPHPYGARSVTEKRVGRRVWMLIALSVFLCILINLMGPATAVLVIPALQWIETSKVGDRMFSHVNTALPPQYDWNGWFWLHTPRCVEHDFMTYNYSCTMWPFGFALDQWVDSYMASLFNTGFTPQQGLSFSLNTTKQANTKNSFDAFKSELFGGNVYSDVINWAPSRQIISNLSTDLQTVQYISNGFNAHQTHEVLGGLGYQLDPFESYVEYNKSLELTLQRNGPIAGAAPTMWGDYNYEDHWTVTVDANRQVRCYRYYNLGYTPLALGTSRGLYTRCIRTGSGWSSTNRQASFFAPGAYDPVTQEREPDVTVTIYSSDRAILLPNDTPYSNVPKACLSGGRLLNSTICNWDRIFTTDPSSPVFNRTQNVNTIEMTASNNKTTATFVVDFAAFFAFTTYSLDSSLVSNPLGIVQNQQLPNNGTSRPVDPNWILAAWSVGDGGTLLANRTTTNLLTSCLNDQLKVRDDKYYNSWYVNDGWSKQDYLALLPIMQALSLVDHSTVLVSDSKQKHDEEHPLLQRNARMYVWAYGFGSRTSYLGAAVAILGCIIVVWQFFLGFTDRRHFRSPTQLIVAALEHSPRGEFTGKGHDEVAMSRVRFHIGDDDSRTGKFSFYQAEPEGH